MALLLYTYSLGLPVAGARQAGTPPNPQPIFEEARRALAAGDYPKAELAFPEVLAIDPRSAAAYTNLGVVYIRINKPDAAINSLESAKKLAPQVVGINLNLGLAYYKKNDFRNAIPNFGRVLASEPGSVQARLSQRLVTFHAGRIRARRGNARAPPAG